MNEVSFDPVFSLWKKEDKAWLEQRRSEWKVLALDAFGETSKRDLALFKKFYLSGVKEKYMPAYNVYFLCPFVTPEEARVAFYSTLFGASERESILKSFIFSVMPMAHSMPWGEDCARSFCQGVLGKKYNVIHSIDMSGVELRAPDAAFFCQRYCTYSVKLMREWNCCHGCLECFEYFLSALRCGFTPSKPHLIDIPSLLSSADDYLREGDNDAVLDFAKKIQSASVEIDTIYQSWFS